MPYAQAAGALVKIGGSILAHHSEKKAAKKAAAATSLADQKATSELNNQYGQYQQSMSPYTQAGAQAQAQYSKLLGLNGNAPDYSVFTSSPQYQFQLQQGQSALDNDAAAKGTLFSGAHTADTLSLAQGLASNAYNQYANRLQSLAGQGLNATNQLGAQGMDLGRSIANLDTNTGQALAGQAINIGNANASMYQNIANTAGSAIGSFGVAGAMGNMTGAGAGGSNPSTYQLANPSSTYTGAGSTANYNIPGIGSFGMEA